jgi:hypothetical protein
MSGVLADLLKPKPSMMAAGPMLGDGLALAVAKWGTRQFRALLGKPGWSGRGWRADGVGGCV